MRKCSYCGKELQEDAKFCPYCGAPCGLEQEAKQRNAGSPENNVHTQKNDPSDAVRQANALGVAGMIVGIVSLVLAFIPGTSFLGFVGGIVGIVLSAVSISNMKRVSTQKNGKAVAGLVCSIIAVIYGVITSFVVCAGCILL